jgi:serine kinase
MPIVHRDLKCENVFLDLYNNVKLRDFDFARKLETNDVSKTFCGSRAYVTPEISYS